MRIVIDINGITAKAGGLAAYMRFLVANLAAIDSKNEYLLYLHQWRTPDRAELEKVLPQQPNFRLLWHRIPNSLSLFVEHRLGLGLTEFLINNGTPTVFHGPANMLPRCETMKSVVTTHHLMSVSDPLFPRDFNARTKFYFSISEKAAREAARIVTVSENTKKDIVKKLGVPAEKISVIYTGVQTACRRIDPCALPPGLAGKLPGKYILFSGPLNARKNLPAFLEAFASVKEKLEGYQIAITSSPPPSFLAMISPLVERLALGERVVFLGELSDEGMAILYNRAQCFAYPSLMEGFGSPPLEAMACGCPVMASNVSAIPEITAGAALLFDPTDRKAMAQALLDIIGDQDLRRGLISKGLDRVKVFSWRRMAEETLAIYKELGEITSS